MPRSISIASRTLTGVNSRPTDGATDWMIANSPIPAGIAWPIPGKAIFRTTSRPVAATCECVAGRLRRHQVRRARQTPIRLRSATPCRPTHIGSGIFVTDVHNRMISSALMLLLRHRDDAVGSPGEVPPLRPVAQIDHLLRRREHQRTRKQHMRQCARIISKSAGISAGVTYPVARTNSLNCRLVTGVRSIKNGSTVTAMHRSCFRVMAVRAHAERAAGNLNPSRGLFAASAAPCSLDAINLSLTGANSVNSPSRATEPMNAQPTLSSTAQ